MTDVGPTPDRSCVALRRARTGDLASIVALLAGDGLPTEGVEERLDRFWVAEDRATPVRSLAGAAGLEVYGGTALLRSVAVAPAWRRTGLAGLLTARMLEEAERTGAHDVVMLTPGAERYDHRLRFLCLTPGRGAVPPGVEGGRRSCRGAGTTAGCSTDDTPRLAAAG